MLSLNIPYHVLWNEYLISMKSISCTPAAYLCMCIHKTRYPNPRLYAGEEATQLTAAAEYGLTCYEPFYIHYIALFSSLNVSFRIYNALSSLLRSTCLSYFSFVRPIWLRSWHFFPRMEGKCYHSGLQGVNNSSLATLLPLSYPWNAYPWWVCSRRATPTFPLFLSDSLQRWTSCVSTI